MSVIIDAAKHGSRRNIILATSATILLLFLVAGLWSAFVFDMQRSEEIRAEVSAEPSSMRLRDFVQMRLLSVATVWTPEAEQSSPERAEFYTQAKHVLDHLPGLLAINWIDREGFIRIVYPEKPNKAALGRDLKTHPSAKTTFLRAMNTGREQLSPPITLYQGGQGLAAYIPVKNQRGEILGFINAVFRLRPLFQAGLGDQLLSHFHVHALYQGKKVFDSQLLPPNEEPDLTWSRPIKLSKDVVFDLQITPLKGKHHWHSIMWFLFAGSLVLSLLLGALLWRLLESRHHLRKSSLFYSQLIATMNEGLFVVDDQGIIQLANSQMHEILQHDKKLEGLHIQDFIPEQSSTNILFSSRDAHPPDIPQMIQWKSKNDTMIPCLVSCRKLEAEAKNQLLCVAMNISERLAAEEKAKSIHNQLIQAQKMEAIGRLAAGVAHDFNNVLTAIIGFAELLEEDLPENSESLDDVHEILRASEQAKSLTQRILHLSRGQHGQARPVLVDESLNNVTAMLRQLVGVEYSIHCTPQAPDAWITIDPNHIENIITNLVINARDAMKQGGSIDIISHVIELDSEDTHTGQLQAGPYVCIVVSDQGDGIPAEILPQVLEPFFTTKPEGQGTGLGLSTVYAMMRSVDGDLHIKSVLGQGTTISLYFPLSTTPEGTKRTEEKIISTPGHDELILVVEDQDMLRKMVARILRKAQYRVLEAADGLEAFELYKKNAQNINFILSDVVMPNVSGPELYKMIDKEKGYSAQSVPFLLMSGHAPNKAFKNFLAGEKRPPIIHKPFKSDALLARIAALLQDSASSPENNKSQ